MIKLCEMLGGSVSYGLDTPDSDRDERFVFLNEETSKIVGLGRFDHLDGRLKDGKDVFGWELSRFFRLLKKNNTGVLEMLYNKKWINLDEKFAEIIQYRGQFLDLNQLYKCLKGYIQHEKHLTMGNKRGQIGGKLFEQVEKFEYSPKNAVQGLRLMWSGVHVMNTLEFPVCAKDYDINVHNMLLNIKIHPEEYTKEHIINLLDVYEKSLDMTFELEKEKVSKTKFNEDLANELILKNYLPILEKNYSQNQRNRLRI